MSLYHALFLTESRWWFSFGSQNHSLFLCKQTCQVLCSVCEIHGTFFSLPLLLTWFPCWSRVCLCSVPSARYSWLAAGSLHPISRESPWKAPAASKAVYTPCGNHRNNTRTDISNRLWKVCYHSCIIACENVWIIFPESVSFWDIAFSFLNAYRKACKEPISTTAWL